MLRWYLNEARRRFELVEYDDRGTPLRILEAFIDPSADNSDLSVPTAAMDSRVIQYLDAAKNGDTTAQSVIAAAVADLMERSRQRSLNGFTFQVINPQRRNDGSYVRDESETITAQVERFNSALDMVGAQKILEQKEFTLRQQMLGAGFDPNEFFTSVPERQIDLSGLPPQNTTTGVKLPPEYIRAYTATEVAAMRAANMAKADRLQQIENLFTARKTGVDNLSGIAAVRQEIQDLESYLKGSESKLDADPGSDKSLGTYVGQEPGTALVHGENAGVAERLVRLRREYAGLIEKADPKMAAQRRRDATRLRGWQAIPEDERRRRWGDAASPPDDVGDDVLYPAANYGYTPKFGDGGSYLPIPVPPPVPQSPKPWAVPADQMDNGQYAKVLQAQMEAASKARQREARLADARQRAESEKAQAYQAYTQEMSQIQAERAAIQAQLNMRGMNGAGTPSYMGG